jgi:hypothetical protein
MKRVNKVAVGVFLFGQALSGAALAASVTINGDNVDYTFDDTMLGLFGPASVSGDTLYFTPVDFSAKSVNGEGYALTNETMNIQVAARDGAPAISNIGLTERGDYLLLGGGSSVDVTGQVRVFDVADPMTDLTGSIVAADPMDETGTPTKNWTANANVDVSGWTGARTFNVTVDNLLLASTDSNASVAFIEKKFVGISVTPIPEAQTSAMMLAGLGLVGWQIRRRRSIAK